MKSLAPSSSCWASRTKVGLTLAFLVTQMSAQAAPDAPARPDPNDTGPVIVSTDRVKPPSKHRKVSPGPVKPETYPTQPQQEVRTLR